MHRSWTLQTQPSSMRVPSSMNTGSSPPGEYIATMRDEGVTTLNSWTTMWNMNEVARFDVVLLPTDDEDNLAIEQ